jgi:hypothetical protein
MRDPTEPLRRKMLVTGQPDRDLAKATQRWTTEEMSRDFTVDSFLAPFVFVTRKADGVRGTLEFTHSPRFYFDFRPDSEVKR